MTERRHSFRQEDSDNSFPNEYGAEYNNANEVSSTPDLDNLELEYDQYKADELHPQRTILSNQADTDREKIANVFVEEQSVRDSNIPSASIEELQYFAHESDGAKVIPSYVEGNVTELEFFNHSLRSKFTLNAAKNYILSIFPIIHWLPHYNVYWFIQDLIAGITVGCVLVPQSMSYAQIATLPPQYGLYSSFIGAFIYSLFATSKDVCIGPVAVMSLETAKIIARVMKRFPNDPDVQGPIIATTTALLCGGIAAGVGFLRLGFLVELISLNAVAGFMTGSALNIISGQVPALMGYGKLVNTRTATYKVIVNTLKHLPDTKLDAVFGLIPLFILYFWRWWCNGYGPKLTDRYYPKGSRGNFLWKKFYFYAQASRSGIIIIVFTAISWSITRHVPSKERRISILGTVPKGLKDVGAIKVPPELPAKIAPELPAAVIVLLLEHIAISKSFGRINDYKVVPDQELIAIGVTNLIGTFFHAYPTTGSFSRSALKAKCNVKTPLSGLFTGSCVLLALYCLTGAFFYIPKATLSAVIIHSVSDLVASYHTTWNFYKMNPLDFVCFLTTIIITVFSSIENGIYFAICWSCALLLFKVAFPAGKFLGRVEIAEVVDGEIINDNSVVMTTDDCVSEFGGNKEFSKDKLNGKSDFIVKDKLDSTASSSSIAENKLKYYTKWVPFDHAYTRELNPDVTIQPPPPGVIVYRMSDSYTYINASNHYDIIIDEIKRVTRRGQLLQHRKKSDRPWNDPGEWKPPKFLSNVLHWRKNKKKNQTADVESLETGIVRDERPVLKVLCLDFSQVAQVDSTSLQSLVDLRKAVNAYADRQVEFHFAGIISPWIKRGLVKIGFGTVNEEFSDESIIAGHSSYHLVKNTIGDIENGYQVKTATGTNLPFFHIDIPDFKKWDI
ncbi:sulfate permease KNAG_0G02070 [Huiozyma naganishii CBS 8797]|uniref:STAS domain-containing protein n=1 Tax=Huiozyma naganishii (strain ATCC MYA-139 / BCRC 22969 / CBS 8797 / KCTC 17520 / NBRC 10181 / NCYC 3082 / Yp74L-3) TaxID=1071383 RepID=J7S7Z7_HUIN7|nr:hypothetical protein KNAG_0G02070 [Kazachstania naganishii CBS 8797]CCK71264.1 hypothetical protein KNAG_0G02070 [Kazachstania naganishii CBS 8797]